MVSETTGASGCSSGVEHNLAKVGVEGSNPFARSSFSDQLQVSRSRLCPGFLLFHRDRPEASQTARIVHSTICADQSERMRTLRQALLKCVLENLATLHDKVKIFIGRRQERKVFLGVTFHHKQIGKSARLYNTKFPTVRRSPA